jgi:hypothetical protein
MPAMLILDKAQALDRIIANSQRIEIPEPFVRRVHHVASFERVDVAIGAPALVLAPQPPARVETPAPIEGQPSLAPTISTRQASPARAFAAHLPLTLSWPAFVFSLTPQPEG